MQAKLRIVGGGERGREIPLLLPASVGRGASNTITLAEPLVSRHHCEIFQRQDRLWVRDCGSLNGTFVGSDRIAEAQLLKPGQLLTVGTVTFRALYGEVAETDASGFMAESIGVRELDTVEIAHAGTVVDPAVRRHSQPASEEERATVPVVIRPRGGKRPATAKSAGIK